MRRSCATAGNRVEGHRMPIITGLCCLMVVSEVFYSLSYGPRPSLHTQAHQEYDVSDENCVCSRPWSNIPKVEKTTLTIAPAMAPIAAVESTLAPSLWTPSMYTCMTRKTQRRRRNEWTSSGSNYEDNGPGATVITWQPWIRRYNVGDKSARRLLMPQHHLGTTKVQ